MAVREIEWPRDVSALAHSLSRAEAWFWLDGEATDPEGGRGRSYLGAGGGFREAVRGHEREFLRELREKSGYSTEDICGWVVALSYEFGVALMGERAAQDDVATAFALRAETVLVLDHARGTAELHGQHERDIEAWLAQHGRALTHPSPRVKSQQQQQIDGLGPQPKWRQSDSEYLARVAECKAAIREGEAYVLCLTDTAEVAADGADPLRLYLSLREADSAARGAVIVAGDRALVSMSPERFLSVRGKRIATHPIKGTRPRGESPGQDAGLAAELRNDPKERAENLMIVDLMRNDLSRVCEPGSVRTEGFLRVESHPRVHQLVSTVTGSLAPGSDVFDAIESCFPGGSMTGAPKRRAVQLLAELERGPRGLYSGCFGWIADSGNAELAMTIRSVELRGVGTRGARGRVGAGGGVTIDSDPAAELAEKHLKAGPLLTVLAEER